MPMVAAYCLVWSIHGVYYQLTIICLWYFLNLFYCCMCTKFVLPSLET
jgi:hypothetical protein